MGRVRAIEHILSEAERCRSHSDAAEAEVDELMTLVDALETQLTASRSTADKLLSALVAELTTR